MLRREEVWDFARAADLDSEARRKDFTRIFEHCVLNASRKGRKKVLRASSPNIYHWKRSYELCEEEGGITHDDHALGVDCHFLEILGAPFQFPLTDVYFLISAGSERFLIDVKSKFYWWDVWFVSIPQVSFLIRHDMNSTWRIVGLAQSRHIKIIFTTTSYNFNTSN